MQALVITFFVHENFKEDIIAKINKIRGVPHPHSANKHALLRKNITMVTPQFVQVLRDVLVDSVTIVGFAQKAPVAWGQKLMQAARGADSNCTCEFDMAAQIPPEKMHWGRYDDHHMAPVELDNKGINKKKLITLLGNTNRIIIESKFGKNARIEHWPQFPMAQLEFNGFKFPPIYGSLNIIPRGTEVLHQKTSNQGELDDMEDDDNGSTNYDEDYDGTQSESNWNAQFWYLLNSS